jgi:hypothetical protein
MSVVLSAADFCFGAAKKGDRRRAAIPLLHGNNATIKLVVISARHWQPSVRMANGSRVSDTHECLCGYPGLGSRELTAVIDHGCCMAASMPHTSAAVELKAMGEYR